MKSKYKYSLAVIAALLLTSNSWAVEASLIPDAGAGKGPIIDQAANGVPVVQIKTPNAAGLSHNQYLDFSVGNKGLILNNANRPVSTELAGYIAANPMMRAYPAKQILNEVTGPSQTALQGALEVAGQRADVIIANPNGILVNNGSFINADQVTLTTGNPRLENGHIAAYDIGQGTITVEGQGLDTSKASRTDILAQAIKVNAGVWANQLRTVTGQNTVTADSLETQPIGDGQANSLDIAALGGMYANTIYLKGTQAGLGVNNKGQLLGQDHITIDSQGNVINAGEIQANTVTIQSAQSLQQEGSMQADTLAINAQKSLENTGTMAGSQRVSMNTETLANSNGGKIYGGAIQIQAKHLKQESVDEAHPSVIVATDSVKIGADTVENKNKGVIKSATTMTIGHTVETEGSVTGSAQELINDGSTIDIGTTGNLAVNTIRNTNTGYTTKQVVVGNPEWIDEVAGSGQPERYTLTDDKVHGNGDYTSDDVVVYKDESNHLAVHGKTYEEWSRYKYSRVTTEDVIDRTNPGTIVAGGDLLITANHVINDVSRISATGALTGSITHLENVNPPGNRVYEDTGTATSYWRHHRRGKDTTGSSETAYNQTTVIPNPVPASVYAEHDATSQGVTLDSYNPMIRMAPNTNTSYFLETDPAFTDKWSFLSSDYFNASVKTSPEYTQKRLGDGYYEQELVMADILRQTGRSRLEAGLTSEEQYRKLMDAGIQASINTSWVLGRALTKEEQAQLTQDIVWLVETSVVLPDGRTVRALVPTVYLAPTTNTEHNSANLHANTVQLATQTMTNRGEIVADKALKLTSDTLSNEGGLLQGKDVSVQALNDIHNTGSIVGGASVDLRAGQDVVNQGGQIVATGDSASMHLQAGRDIRLEGKRISNTKSVAWDARNTRKETNTDVVQGLVQAKGTVSLIAGQDIRVAGSQVASGKTLQAMAGRNVTVSAMDSEATVQEEHYHVGKTGGGNKQVNETHERTQVVNQVAGSLSGQDVSIYAGDTLTVSGSEVLASNRVQADANTVQLDTAETLRHEEKEEHIRKSGVFSKEKTEGITKIDTKTVTGATISGKTVDIVGRQSVNGISATVLGEEGLAITSGGDLTLVAGQNASDVVSKYQTKKSGILSGGSFGVSIGSEKLKTADMSHEENTLMSTLASSKGAVSLTANKDLHVTSAEVVGQTGIQLTGASVTLDGNTDATHQTHDVEYKKTGVTVSLGGIVPDTINTTQNLLSRAQSRDDKRLAAFEVNEARRQLQDSLKDVKDNLGKTFVSTPDKNGRVHTEKGNDHLVNLNVSVGSSKYSNHDSIDQSTYRNGYLVSAGDITVQANDPSSSGIHMVGEEVTGNTVRLESASDINLEAGKNELHAKSDAKSSGWSVGATLGLQGSGFMGLTANANTARDNGLTDQVSYTGTHIQANDIAQIKAQRDTTITGSQVKADAIKVDTGHNLSITSLQEEDNYKEKSSSAGLSLTTSYSPLSKPNVFTGLGNGSIDSTYKSVQEQAGLYAGKKGYDIKVGDTTKLTGALIASEASKDKNHLETGNLVMNDLENEAHYSYSNQGLQYKGYANPKDATGNISSRVYNQMGLTPNLMPGATGKATSTTKSAISDGQIVVEGKTIDTRTINTNTNDTVHTLSKIFDKKKIEERQELARYFAQNAFEAVHRLGEQYGDPKDPNNPWRDGGVNKVLLHSAIAEITAQLAGNAPGSGAFAGAVNEAAINKIVSAAGQKNPDVGQILSSILGEVSNKVLSKSTTVGAALAQYGTKWNRYGKRRYFVGEIVLDKDGQWWRHNENGTDEALTDVPPIGTIFFEQDPEVGYQSNGWDKRLDPGYGSTYINEDTEDYIVYGNFAADKLGKWVYSADWGKYIRADGFAFVAYRPRSLSPEDAINQANQNRIASFVSEQIDSRFNGAAEDADYRSLTTNVSIPISGSGASGGVLAGGSKDKFDNTYITVGIQGGWSGGVGSPVNVDATYSNINVSGKSKWTEDDYRKNIEGISIGGAGNISLVSAGRSYAVDGGISTDSYGLSTDVGSVGVSGTLSYTTSVNYDDNYTIKTTDEDGNPIPIDIPD